MINIFSRDKICEFPLLHGKENPEFSLLYQSSDEFSSYLVCHRDFIRYFNTGSDQNVAAHIQNIVGPVKLQTGP